MVKKLSTEEFIRKAKVIHGDKYCYDAAYVVLCTTLIDLDHFVFLSFFFFGCKNAPVFQHSSAFTSQSNYCTAWFVLKISIAYRAYIKNL